MPYEDAVIAIHKREKFENANILTVDIDVSDMERAMEEKNCSVSCNIPLWMKKKSEEYQIDCSDLLKQILTWKIKIFDTVRKAEEYNEKAIHIRTRRGRDLYGINAEISKDMTVEPEDWKIILNGNGAEQVFVRIGDIAELETTTLLVIDKLVFHLVSYDNLYSEYTVSVPWISSTLDLYIPSDADTEGPDEQYEKIVHSLLHDRVHWDKATRHSAVKALLKKNTSSKKNEAEYSNWLQEKLELAFITVSFDGTILFEFLLKDGEENTIVDVVVTNEMTIVHTKVTEQSIVRGEE